MAEPFFYIIRVGVGSELQKGEAPIVESSLGVVPRVQARKHSRIMKTRYVDGYLIKKVLKIEGLSDRSDSAKKGAWRLMLL